ncbi:hypothetical protein O9929_15595 [Vibrio lentus]|nr:hypothetical protein [Vibrio lentus]
MEYEIPVEDFEVLYRAKLKQQRQIITEGAEILLPLDESMVLTRINVVETCVIE